MAEVLIQFWDPPGLPQDFTGYTGPGQFPCGIAPGAGTVRLVVKLNGPGDRRARIVGPVLGGLAPR